MTAWFDSSREVGHSDETLKLPKANFRAVPDDDDVVPYTVWDNHTKIVLRLKTELQYHDTSPDSRLPRRAETAWVNYIFADEPSMQAPFRKGSK